MPAYRPRCVRLVCLPMLSSLILCVCSPSLWSQDNPPQSEPTAGASNNAPENGTIAAGAEPFPNLMIPADATAVQLEDLIAKAKHLQPNNEYQYQVMQTAIRDASKQLVKLLGKSKGGDAKNAAERVQQAELDTISSSMALMAFVGEDAQQKTLEQVHEFLKGRKEISIQDTQTVVLAAAMLELQPDKKPARDTYQLLYDLLETDERE
ncbi:MAG: hypothetical protein ABI557_04525, partial [Aureliella sp.]